MNNALELKNEIYGLAIVALSLQQMAPASLLCSLEVRIAVYKCRSHKLIEASCVEMVNRLKKCHTNICARKQLPQIMGIYLISAVVCANSVFSFDVYFPEPLNKRAYWF